MSYEISCFLHLIYFLLLRFDIFQRTLSEACESVQEKIINQMILWDNEDCGTKPGDSSPHGQKCLYKVCIITLANFI